MGANKIRANSVWLDEIQFYECYYKKYALNCGQIKVRQEILNEQPVRKFCQKALTWYHFDRYHDIEASFRIVFYSVLSFKVKLD